MNRFVRIVACMFFVGSLLHVATRPLIAAPAVNHFFPYQGPAGTLINVFGSGFTGTSQVIFDPTNNPTFATFSVVNDSTLRVVAPPRDINDPLQQSFLVRAGSAATLALADDATQVLTTASFVGGSHYFVVNSGGILTGGGGSSLTYIKSGGRFNDTGGGTRIVVVETGGIFQGVGGGTTRVYREPGASVTLSIGGDNSQTSIADVSLSVVPRFYTYGSNVVPEPASWLLASFALAALAAIRRRT
jgi:MYXO-CTERM domain-containing protein